MDRLQFVRTWLSETLSVWLTKIVWCLAVASLPVCAAPPTSTTVQFPGRMALQDGKLTARIVSGPLPQVMDEVSKLSGAQIRWMDQDSNETVSIEFADLSLSEAVRRILGERNFILFYTSAKREGTLSQIWIFSKRSLGMQSAITPAPTARDVRPPTADTAGSVERELEVLIQMALYARDHIERLDAVTQLGGYSERDQRVKAILSQIAQTDGNVQVKEAARELLQNKE
jgi:hypothetical protein